MPLLQKRNIRNGIELQISRVENSREKGYEKHVADLKGQLYKAENDDEPLEKQHEILLRKALKESELQKFQALREVIHVLWVQLSVVSCPLSFSSLERSFPSLRRLQSRSSLSYLPSPPRHLSRTLPAMRRALSVLPCSMRWITGSPAKPPCPRLRMLFWIVPTRAALARLTLKNCSRSPQPVPVPLFMFLPLSRFKSQVPPPAPHRLRRRRGDRSAHP